MSLAVRTADTQTLRARRDARLLEGKIAIITGVGENTVKSRMRYALDRLRQTLSEFEEYAQALR